MIFFYIYAVIHVGLPYEHLAFSNSIIISKIKHMKQTLSRLIVALCCILSLSLLSAANSCLTSSRIINGLEIVWLDNLVQCVGPECAFSDSLSFQIENCEETFPGGCNYLTVNLSIDISGDGTIDNAYNYPEVNDQYIVPFTALPPGEHILHFVIYDVPNNSISFQDTLVIEECETMSPPICKENLSISLTNNEDGIYYDLTYDQLLLDTAQDCTGTELFYSLNIASSTNPYPHTGHRKYYCEDIGEIDLRVWAWDEDFNKTFCQTTVTILDEQELCGDEYVIIEPLSSDPYQIGDTLEFATKIGGIPDLMSLQFAVTWDTTFFDFVDVNYTNSTTFGNLVYPELFSSPETSPNVVDRINLSWFDPYLQGNVDVTNSTVIYHFKLLAKECGITSISPDDINPYLHIEILNSSFQKIHPLLLDANVELQCPLPLTPIELSFPPIADVSVGDTICMPLTITNMNDIIAFDFMMEYESNDLQFVSIENLNPSIPNFTENGSFGLPGQGIIEEGQINILYYLFVDPITLPAADTLFEVCFKVKESAAACTEIGISGLTENFPAFYFEDLQTPEVIINSNSISIINEIIYDLCSGESLSINNTHYDEDHMHGMEIFDGNLCDSMLSVQLIFNENDTTYLNDILHYGEAYIWNDMILTEAGVYSQIFINENGCDSLVMLQLELEILNNLQELSSKQYVQSNAITPNNDGLNDYFIIELIENNPLKYPDNELIIFDRLGNIVYQAAPYNNNWKGTKQDDQKPLAAGTYFYIFKPSARGNDVIKGSISIIR